MSQINLADPDFEPTDEQFRELMKRAFAHLPEQERRMQEKMDADIRRGTEEVVARFAHLLVRRVPK